MSGMSIETAVEELQALSLELQKQLVTVDTQREAIESEYDRVEGALSALQAGQGVETFDDSPSSVTEHTGKYRDLWLTLRNRDDDEWATTFSEIEDVLGFSLPKSARKYLPAWYGAKGSAVARAITDAGWRASSVNIKDETLVFRRR
jgi:hypothetical protein